MEEQYILVKNDLSLSVNPVVDTRYVILVRGNVSGSCTVEMKRTGQRVSVIGLMLGKAEEKAEFSFIVRHMGKDTKSTIRVSTFAAGRASVLVKNDVRIEKKSFGSMTEIVQRTLRLSEESRIRSLPMLGMDHENLTASHAAIIDGFDATSLRYLLSRGISVHEARKTLAFGMVRSLLENVSNPDTRQTLYNEWEKFYD